MKLYFFPVAPNPTRVRLYLAEKAEGGHPVPLEEVLVDLRRGEQRTPEHRRRNPLARLPVLELDDGTFLTESLAIMEYLEELYAAPPLLGLDALSRARIRELERIAELGVLLPVAWLVHATNSPLGLPPKPELAAFFRDRLPAALEVLEKRLADGRPFVAGAAPSIADCTLAAALQFARFGKIEVLSDYPHLTRWDSAYRERPPARQVLVV